MDTISKSYNINLANYFARKSLYLDEPTQKKPNTRKLVELPWQQTKALLWNEVTETLCDLHFIEAKCKAAKTFALIDDYIRVLKHLPENQTQYHDEKLRHERIDNWTLKLIEYSRKWSLRHKLYSQCVVVDTEEPQIPEPPSQLELWPKTRINTEFRQLVEKPIRLARLTDFRTFVTSQCYPLIQYSNQPGFVPQHACNYQQAGPVHEAALKILSATQMTYFLRHWPENIDADPRPALLNTLEGHMRTVNCVSISANGRRAVSGSDDNTIRVWDPETGICLQTLIGHTSAIHCLSMTPDGQQAVSGSGRDKIFDNSVDFTVRLWDLKTGACLHTMPGHTNDVLSVCITPDGSQAVSASRDNTLRVWDLNTGSCLHILQGHTGLVSSVSMAADGMLAVSGSDDDTCRVWDLENGICLQTLFNSIDDINKYNDWKRWNRLAPSLHPWREPGINSIQVTLDGKLAISAHKNSILKVWDMKTGKCLHIIEDIIHPVRSLCITPNARLATGVTTDHLYIFDLVSGEYLCKIKGTTFSCISVTADGIKAITTGEGDTLQVWDLEKARHDENLDKHDSVEKLRITPNGHWAVSTGLINTMSIWDLHQTSFSKIFETQTDFIISGFVTPDGQRAVCISSDLVFIYDLASGECVHKYDKPGNTITCSAFTPDGRWIITGDDSGWLHTWDLEIGSIIRSLVNHRSKVNCVSVTNDGKRGVSGNGGRMCKDYTVKVWDLDTGICLRTFEGHTGEVNSVGFSTDSQRVVSYSADETLRVWDLQTRDCILRIENVGSGYSDHLDLTTDGRLAVFSDEKLLKVWNLNLGECINTFSHDDWIGKVNIAADGKIAITTHGSELLLWELDSGIRKAIHLSSTFISSVVISPSSSYVILGTTAGEVVFLEIRGLPDIPFHANNYPEGIN